MDIKVELGYNVLLIIRNVTTSVVDAITDAAVYESAYVKGCNPDGSYGTMEFLSSQEVKISIDKPSNQRYHGTRKEWEEMMEEKERKRKEAEMAAMTEVVVSAEDLGISISEDLLPGGKFSELTVDPSTKIITY